MDDTEDSKKPPSTSKNPLEIMNRSSNEVDSLDGFDLGSLPVIPSASGVSKYI